MRLIYWSRATEILYCWQIRSMNILWVLKTAVQKNKTLQVKQLLATKKKIHLIIPDFPLKYSKEKGQLKSGVSLIIGPLLILK